MNLIITIKLQIDFAEITHLPFPFTGTEEVDCTNAEVFTENTKHHLE